jgi:hypothetical protein
MDGDRIAAKRQRLFDAIAASRARAFAFAGVPGFAGADDQLRIDIERLHEARLDELLAYYGDDAPGCVW